MKTPTNPLGMSRANRITIGMADRRRQLEPPTAKWGDSTTKPKYQLPGFGLVVFRGFNPHGWPIFNLARDPVYFGPLIVQGEAGSAFANEMRRLGHDWSWK